MDQKQLARFYSRNPKPIRLTPAHRDQAVLLTEKEHTYKTVGQESIEQLFNLRHHAIGAFDSSDSAEGTGLNRVQYVTVEIRSLYATGHRDHVEVVTGKGTLMRQLEEDSIQLRLNLRHPQSTAFCCSYSDVGVDINAWTYVDAWTYSDLTYA